MPTKILTLLLFPFVLIGITSCGGSDKEEPRSKANSPPMITSASILPERPTQDNDLGVSLQSKDPDEDPITYLYQWIKNDTKMVGENKNMLKRGTFKKGDIIQVRIVPSDGKTEGEPFLTSPVRILNTPPIIQEIRIEPKIATASEDLKAIVKGFDLDGDFIYYTYRWEKNGVLLEEDKEILGRGNFKKGDSIAVTATPDDREVTGTPKKSETIIILNSPPFIISSPPNSVDKSTYVYQVKANDPDNDPVTFILRSGPKGMEIDKTSGLIRWEIRKEDKGTHQIEIEVSDNEGAKSIQRYLLTVDFKP